MNRPPGRALLEAPLNQLHRITQNQEPITAADHPIFREVAKPSSISPGLPLSRVLTVHTTLPSGILQERRFEHITPEGARALTRWGGLPFLLGNMTMKLSAPRLKQQQDGKLVIPQTALYVGFPPSPTGRVHAAGMTNAQPYTVEPLMEETARAWAAWGVDLYYNLGGAPTSSYRALQPLLHEQHPRQIAEELARIAEACTRVPVPRIAAEPQHF